MQTNYEFIPETSDISESVQLSLQSEHSLVIDCCTVSFTVLLLCVELYSAQRIRRRTVFMKNFPGH